MAPLSTTTSPHTFDLPDLITACPYPLVYHKNGDAIAAASDAWYENGCSNFTEEKRRHLSVLAAGKLSAYVYNDTDDQRLRCSCDFMQLIFLYGDVSEGLMIKGNEMVADIVMNAFWFPDAYRPTHATGKLHPRQEPDVSKLARDLWTRCRQNAGPGFQARLLENLGLFFDGRHVQAKHRQTGIIPTLQAYIDIRRDSSGLKPLMDFLEYTLGIDLPGCVVENFTMKILKQCVNDFCTWSNDLFSFNKEQASGETYNMVVILMKVEGLALQEAVDHVGDMCLSALETFQRHRKNLPKWGDTDRLGDKEKRGDAATGKRGDKSGNAWGAQVDVDVERYMRGLESWLVACLHWSFLSGRYFGTKGAQIKQSGVVELMPARQALKGVKN